MEKFTNDKIYKGNYLFISIVKAIKNNLRFFNVFITSYKHIFVTLVFLLSLL